MLNRMLLSPILESDALTRGLGDEEARILVEWLVDKAEGLADDMESEVTIRSTIQHLHRRARAIGRFVGLWCHQGDYGGAGQLAAAERFNWPLPTTIPDPCELMHGILTWETQEMQKI